MAERRVRAQQVEFALASPDLAYPDRKGNPILVRWAGARRMKVVVPAGSQPLLVTTVGD